MFGIHLPCIPICSPGAAVSPLFLEVECGTVRRYVAAQVKLRCGVTSSDQATAAFARLRILQPCQIAAPSPTFYCTSSKTSFRHLIVSRAPLRSCFAVARPRSLTPSFFLVLACPSSFAPCILLCAFIHRLLCPGCASGRTMVVVAGHEPRVFQS